MVIEIHQSISVNEFLWRIAPVCDDSLLPLRQQFDEASGILISYLYDAFPIRLTIANVVQPPDIPPYELDQLKQMIYETEAVVTIVIEIHQTHPRERA